MLTWFRKHTKTIMIVVALVFVASMFYGLGYGGLSSGAGSGGKTSVLAKVNGQELDPYRYREIMNRLVMNFGGNINPQEIPFVENMALGQAVDFTLLLNEAKKRVRVPGRELDAAIQNIMQQQKIPSKRDLEAALKRNGISLDKFKEIIKGEILVQKLYMKLQEEVRVSTDDLKEVRASHILVSTESQAKDILGQLRNGGDFVALAKKYSRDTGSAIKGGDLGYFTTGSMVAPFEKTAFALKAGQVSGLVQTPFGYHIIKVTDSRLRTIPGDNKNIEQVILKEKQEKSFRQWFSEIRQKAKVEIISPELKANEYRFKGQIPLAIEEYKKAIAQNPANPFLHIFLGDTFLAIGQKALAFSEYENAVKIEGGNPEIYLILGKAYEGAGEKGLAAEQYKKASLIAGDNKVIHEKLLKVFEKMKRSAEIAREKAEINRLNKKEAFEKELTGPK